MENQKPKKFEFTTQQIAVLGVLMALEIALSRVSIFLGPNNRLSFGFIITSIIGLLFGPWVAGLAGAGTDLLTAFMFGVQGTFFFGFTFTAFAGAFVYGAFLHRKEIRWTHVLGAVLVNSIVTNLVLNTLWIHLLYETPITVLLATRIPQNLIMAPVRFAVIYLITRNPELGKIFERYSTANK